ncbi:hypothetical protein [Pseudophaeobacter sp.]|uniref:hypothetical protein n=1 Tax=Pseudophaeobacter sp. TaxID=1971739 RepID=UPI003297976D
MDRKTNTQEQVPLGMISPHVMRLSQNCFQFVRQVDRQGIDPKSCLRQIQNQLMYKKRIKQQNFVFLAPKATFETRSSILTTSKQN